MRPYRVWSREPRGGDPARSLPDTWGSALMSLVWSVAELARQLVPMFNASAACSLDMPIGSIDPLGFFWKLGLPLFIFVSLPPNMPRCDAFRLRRPIWFLAIQEAAD